MAQSIHELLKARLSCGRLQRDNREGWPLLTVEVNGDSKSLMKGSFLGFFVGLSCRCERFLFCLGCSSRLSTRYFFPSPYTVSFPLSSSPSKLGRQQCWVTCLLVCVSGHMMRLQAHPHSPPLSRQYAVPAIHRKTEIERQFTDGRGGKGCGRRAELYDCKKAWPSINHQASLIHGFDI
jgi:hypothetical protein